MLRLSFLCALAIVAVQTGFADTKSEILSLTGNARTKLVWVRFPWCDSTYTPVQEYKTDNSLGNSGPFTQLIAFDTDEGVLRYLDQQNDFHTVPRITRKDGSHVIWTDKGDSCSWIRDHAAAAPKRKLLEGGDFIVVQCRYDAAEDREYIYTLSGDGKRLTMIPLRDDYTADTASKTLVYTASDKMKTSLGISADGQYLGTHIPWPTTMIVEMQSGQIFYRHTGEVFGCEPNLAPDDSYRFFYHSSEHDSLRMWGPDLTETMWHVPVNKNLPGAGTRYFDTMGPRWTNRVEFFTISYPLLSGFEVNWDMLDVFRMSADQMKAEDPAKAGTFLLGKFADDFKSVEKYVNVSGTDIRRRDAIGDAWIAATASSALPENLSVMQSFQLSINARGGSIEATLPASKPGSIVLLNAFGKVVSYAAGTGRIRCSLGGRAAGVVLVKVISAGQIQVSREILR